MIHYYISATMREDLYIGFTFSNVSYSVKCSKEELYETIWNLVGRGADEIEMTSVGIVEQNGKQSECKISDWTLTRDMDPEVGEVWICQREYSPTSVLSIWEGGIEARSLNSTEWVLIYESSY
jgi:hypothetical protein